MKNILFLCTGNSCRSQMAEAFAKMFAKTFTKSLLNDPFCVFSAGIEKHGLNPMMLKVMNEIGVEMSSHSSKTVEELPEGEWFMVVTVCSHAEENCPFLPAQHHVHLPFDDPPSLSRCLVDEEEILAIYRRVRDEIRKGVDSLLQNEGGWITFCACASCNPPHLNP